MSFYVSDSAIFETPANSDAEEDAAAGPPPKPVLRAKPAAGPPAHRDPCEPVDDPPVRKCVSARRRASTFFPEEHEADTVGAWRMTKVDGTSQDELDFDSAASWLLVGRRHSVDERREQTMGGKRLFLRQLATEADIPWRERVEAQGAELAEFDGVLRTEMAHQLGQANATKDFWCGSFVANRSYLSNLERVTGAANASSLLSETGQAALEQVEYASKATVRAEAWALWLPGVVESHAAATEEVSRTLGRAMQDVKMASELVQNRRQTLWPQTTELAGAADRPPPNGHSADAGPGGDCLWLAACQYLTSRKNLEDSHQAALSQLRRQEKQTKLLSQWLDEALSSNGSEGKNMPSMLESLPCQHPASPSFGPSDDPMGADVELAALVVHEVDAEVCYEYPRDTSSESTWVSVHLLLSVDLRLHIWEKPGMDYHLTVAPSDSVDLLHECNRPVAVRSCQDSRVVQIAVCPDETKTGVMANLSRALWYGAPTRPPRRGLQFRCADDYEAGALLAAFDVIEQLYPSTATEP